MFEAFKRRQSKKEDLDELLSAYLDGQLAVDEQTQLEVRLAREPMLRERLEGLRWIVEALAGLPEVETPRNFILSSSMVAAPTPTAKPPRRQAWPVLGWATAVATLLFVLILAGDVFVVAPSLRPEPAAVVTEEPRLMRQMTGSDAAQNLAGTPSVAPAGVAQPVELEMEKGVAPAAEAPPEEMPEAMPAEELTDESFQPETPLLEGVTMSAAQESVGYQGPVSPSYGVTVTVEAEAEIVFTPPPPAAVLTEELPLAVSPPVDRGEQDSDTGARLLLPQGATVTPGPIAVVPVEGMSPAVGAGRAAEGVPLWLRVVEIGLGLAVVGLAAATFIARRREA